jgi:hypothetical protein
VLVGAYLSFSAPRFRNRKRNLAAHNADSPAGESPAMENDDEPSRDNRLG